jgi:hypothetical protein
MHMHQPYRPRWTVVKGLLEVGQGAAHRALVPSPEEEYTPGEVGCQPLLHCESWKNLNHQDTKNPKSTKIIIVLTTKTQRHEGLEEIIDISVR